MGQQLCPEMQHNWNKLSHLTLCTKCFAYVLRNERVEDLWRLCHKKAFEVLERKGTDIKPQDMEQMMLGDFTFEKRLGKKSTSELIQHFYGSEGAVWSVYPKGSSQKIAVKIIYNCFDQNTIDLKNNCTNEFLLVQRLCKATCQYTISMFSCFVDTVTQPIPDWDATHVSLKSLCLTMEFFPWNLKQFIAHKELNEHIRLRILLQLCQGVEYLKKNNVVHADIKMDNILVSEQESIVLTDFGCALELPGLKMNFVSKYIRRGGNLMSLPPEVKNAEAGPATIIDYAKCDSFAVGCVGYQISSEEHPYKTSQRLPSKFSQTCCSVEFKEIVEGMVDLSFTQRMDSQQAIKKIQQLLWNPPNTDLLNWVVAQQDQLISKMENLSVEESLKADFLDTQWRLLSKSFVKLQQIPLKEPPPSPDFKEQYSFEKRVEVVQNIRSKYPDRIPVIVQRTLGSKIKRIAKTKFLVSGDMNFSKFTYEVRKHIPNLPNTESIFLFVKGNLPPSSCLLSIAYERWKDEDGFLYVNYSGEVSFD